MIDLFGRLRLRWMGHFDVAGVPLLLNACTKSLKILELHPTEPHGEWFPQKGVHISTNDSAVSSSPRDLDLSPNDSLETLKIEALRTGYRLSTGSLDATFSTHSRQSYPLYPSRSGSFMDRLTSLEWNPGSTQTGLLYARHHELEVSGHDLLSAEVSFLVCSSLCRG